MSKFKYYIVNLFDGNVTGTNKKETAEELSQVEEYFVIDTETNELLLEDGARRTIGEQ